MEKEDPLVKLVELDKKKFDIFSDDSFYIDKLSLLFDENVQILKELKLKQDIQNIYNIFVIRDFARFVFNDGLTNKEYDEYEEFLFEGKNEIIGDGTSILITFTNDLVIPIILSISPLAMMYFAKKSDFLHRIGTAVVDYLNNEKTYIIDGKTFRYPKNVKFTKKDLLELSKSTVNKKED